MTTLPSFISLVPYYYFFMSLAVLGIERETERERVGETKRREIQIELKEESTSCD